MIAIGRLFSRWTQWASWCLLVAKFISVKTLPWKWRCMVLLFWVVHLPVAKQRIFNCTIPTVTFFSRYQLICEHFGENYVTRWLTVAKLWCIKLCFISRAPCRTVRLCGGEKNTFDDMFSRFDRIPSCDKQTDGQTDILRQHRPRYE